MRLKQMHMAQEMTVLGYIFEIAKVFLSEKMKNRVSRGEESLEPKKWSPHNHKYDW